LASTARFAAVAAIVVLCACARTPPGPEAVPVGETPANLDGWHVLTVVGRRLVPRADALPYDLNTPLFSDYAHKLRTVWVPPGTHATYDADAAFDFPVGSVLTKTFFYPRQDGQLDRDGSGMEFSSGELDLEAVRLIETRVLVRRADGWEALPYVWNERQDSARLALAGDMQALSLATPEGVVRFEYVVPTRNECASCHASNHTTGELSPIGPKARHLNKVYAYYRDGPGDQLDAWREAGILAGVPAHAAIPVAAAWPPAPDGDLDFQARSYLDINCGHCHNPVGSADTSGLFLDHAETNTRHLGICKPPIAAGRGSGGRSVSIYPGAPGQSILYFRIESRDPAAMMPELGRSLVHREGVELVRRWIASMDGDCAGAMGTGL
jgi:uncharacterized repeat protein (TIGR03806 family)